MPALGRRLSFTDSVFIGLGAMIGAGIFAVPAVAAASAGWGMLLALILASLLAYCNAVSSAQLAAVYPESGGAYTYGRKQLHPWAGFAAGWSFLFGKIASCGAMALTAGAYLWPGQERWLAVAVVAALTGLNLLGIKKTALATRVLVMVVIAVLLVSLAAIWFGHNSGKSDQSHGMLSQEFVGSLVASVVEDPLSVLQASALWFFAFAGYARLATLGEEVQDPAKTIPRAIPVAFFFVVTLYLLVAITLLLSLGPARLGQSSAPLADALLAGGFPPLAVMVRLAAGLASMGVLLSLLAGLSRTSYAMASAGDLPSRLGRIHPRFQVPHISESLAGALVILLILVADLRTAIGFSSFLVLIYYSVTNASSLSLRPEQRRWPAFLSVLGLFGCIAFAFSLPVSAVLSGLMILAIGFLYRSIRLAARR